MGRRKPPIPFDTRKAVRERSQGLCEQCGARKPLEMHHLHYKTRGKESPCDLVHLCRDCHKERHWDNEGTYWRDPVKRARHSRGEWEQCERHGWYVFYDELNLCPWCVKEA